ncbi:putative ribose-5-phosphate isomerase 1 [Citrus sinensis]|nr:putative ribose-5-phosphate isomerase 1 [Citrus sinensis]
MVVGLGTDSTATHAVDKIGELLHQGKLKNIVGIPTSKTTHDQAVSLGIPLSDLDSHPVIDLAIDGADEVDPSMNLKKRVERACKKFIVIVDESKLMTLLGGQWSGYADFPDLFKDCGCVAKLRTCYEKHNGNCIIDLYFKKDIGDMEVASNRILRLIAGVVEQGMFLDMATTVIIVGKHGVTIKNK